MLASTAHPTLNRLEDFPPLAHTRETQLAKGPSVASSAAPLKTSLSAKQSPQDRFSVGVNDGSSALLQPRFNQNATESETAVRGGIANSRKTSPDDHLEDPTVDLAASTDQDHRPTKPGDTAASLVHVTAETDEGQVLQPGKALVCVAPDNLDQDADVRDGHPPSNTTTLNPTTGVVKPLRTLRVIDVPKADVTFKSGLGKSSSQTESSTPFPVLESHEVSRRPSLTSINIPSTPSNELHSETASYADSHPDSPAGSKSGTGISRGKSKSQTKKDRRVRRAEESRSAEAADTTSSEPIVVQEAIIGRKKKAKKNKPTSPTKKVKIEEDCEPSLQDARPVCESKSEKSAVEMATRHSMSQADRISFDKQADKSRVNFKLTEGDAEGSKSNKPGTTEDPLATFTDKKEWIDGFSLSEILDDMIRKRELQAYVADLVLNPPGLRAPVFAPIRQTVAPQLTPEQNAILDSGEPVIVESIVYDGVDGSTRSPHPYPYSVVLPNSERTVFPMATKQEADLHKTLFLNTKFKPPSLAQLSSANKNHTKTNVQPLYGPTAADVSLSHFSSIHKRSSGDSGKSRMTFEQQTSRDLDDVQGPAPQENAMNIDAVVCHWMEDSSREIHSIDAAFGGNHFERSRATALGHGPVRLDAPNEPGSFGGPTSAPPLPLSTHPILGTRALDAVTGAGTGRPAVSQNQRDFMDMFRRAVSVLSQPLKSQSLLQDMEAMTLAEVEMKLGEVEDYVVQLKKEADNADKKVLMLSKKHNKQVKAQPKASIR